MNSSKRVFVSIPLPGTITTLLQELQKQFHHPSFRWTPIQNLHITVHFIGNVEQELLRRISEQIKHTVGKFCSFELVSHELQVIRKNKKPLMIWTNFRENKSFETLANELRTILPGDVSKPAAPHITLARFGKWEKAPKLDILPSHRNFSIMVNSIELWESVLGSGNPVYQCLERFPLESEMQVDIPKKLPEN